jgi:uncharacterized membrane protein
MSPALDLTLTPNRSFDRRHMRWLVTAVGGIFLLGGLRFLALGAWPVLPFMVADLALLWWAFRASYAAGAGHERVTLVADALTLVRVSAQGQVRRFGFEPLFTQVQVEETPLGDAHVFLAARGRRVRVGGFLSAPERRQVGAAIDAALAHYKGGGYNGGSPSTASIV